MEIQSDIQGQTTVSNTAAEMIFTFASRAPEVLLSFEGLAAPTPLFVDLNRLGWGIPAIPPPPSTAIDWTPDPVAGTDYTLRPWRVTEFRLAAGGWAESSERAIGGLTIQVLKNHGVNITDIRGLSEAEAQAVTGQPAAPAQASPDGAATAAAAGAPAAPAAATSTQVIFIFDPEPSAEMAGFRTFVGLQGRKKVKCTWHEGRLSEGANVPDATGLSELAERGGGVWHISGDNRPVGNSIMQMLAPDMSADDPNLSKLLKLTGEGATVVPLSSMSGGKDAVLVCLKVPGHSKEMLATNLRVRFPELVFRDDA